MILIDSFEAAQRNSIAFSFLGKNISEIRSIYSTYQFYLLPSGQPEILIRPKTTWKSEMSSATFRIDLDVDYVYFMCYIHIDV